MKVSIRQLKDRLSEHLRAVGKGRSIIVTSHRKPVARLSPVPGEPAVGVQKLIQEGRATWNGKKPRGLAPRARARTSRPGKSVADMVLEDRR